MRHAWLRLLLTVLLLLAAAGFGALSAWQWQRLAWKEALLARIERQQAAAPQPLPAAASWPGLTPEADEYRPISLRGQFEPQHEIRVLASTELGRGYWVMVPLRLPSGLRVWLNRGFVAEAQAAPAAVASVAAALPHAAPHGEVAITGLLRFSEPGRWLWQHNDAAAGRWVGREVAALSRAVGITAAPFFVDVAERGEQRPGDSVQPGTAGDSARVGDNPRGGMTVLRFSNNHRVYALTWLALAAGSVAAAVLLWRHRPDPAAA